VADPYELQRKFVDRLRSGGVVVGDSVRANFTPFLIPVGGPLRRPGRGRVLLAGDAGGFVNGFTAEGIYYAMVSGELAARTVAESPSTPAKRH
jgi:flavin-dependent dehydrogenase